MMLSPEPTPEDMTRALDRAHPEDAPAAPGFTWHAALNSPVEGMVLLELESQDANKRLRLVFSNAEFLQFYRALGSIASRIDLASPERS